LTTRVMPGAESFRFDEGPIGILLQHGFTGCPASMRPLGERLAGRGLSVVAPRLPGHGTTWQDLEATTWQDWVGESETALLDLSRRCPTVVAMGLSMGGAIALHLGARHQERLKGVVAVNPVVRRPDLRLAPLARLFTRTVRGIGGDIKRSGVDEIYYDRTPLKAAAQLGRFLRVVWTELPSMRVPLLVFSSVEDHLVKPVNSRLVMRRAGSDHKELIPLTNSYHVATLDYDADLIFQRVLEFATSLAGASPAATG
jgi:carboxylesterase